MTLIVEANSVGGTTARADSAMEAFASRSIAEMTGVPLVSRLYGGQGECRQSEHPRSQEVGWLLSMSLVRFQGWPWCLGWSWCVEIYPRAG
jgi:hypothetical protein